MLQEIVTRNYLLYNKMYVRNIFKMKEFSFFKGNECKKIKKIRKKNIFFLREGHEVDLRHEPMILYVFFSR